MLNRPTVRQTLSVNRLDFLLSDFAFRQLDGTWVRLTNSVAYISARESKNHFVLNSIPDGPFDRMQFLVGLRPELNHRDPAHYAADHPLNPNLNGLHWGWMGGYVFFAIEGRWAGDQMKPNIGRTSGVGGYSFHIATDRHLIRVELPLAFDASEDRKAKLTLNVDKIFVAPKMVVLGDETVSTHSRADDSLADQLAANIQSAFAVELVPMATKLPSEVDGPKLMELAPTATPYRLTISEFFPRPALPLDNPITKEGVALGRQLFFERQLSANDSQSCASCHEPGEVFVDRGKRFSLGAEGKVGTRNSMPLVNLAWKSSFFWDGRSPSLRKQVLQPIENPIEMHETVTNVVVKLARRGGILSPDYSTLFERAFGTPEITAERMARALEQFLLVQVSYDSKFDQVLLGRQTFTEEEQRGFELFHTEYDPRRGQFGADCFHCHGGPLFQSQSFANNGLDSEFVDLGRYAVTKRPGDEGKFAVPSLRNVELTAPYMHDGRFATLEEVADHYSSGVKPSATLDPNLAKHPAGGIPLTQADKRALVAFLKTLTAHQFAHVKPGS